MKQQYIQVHTNLLFVLHHLCTVMQMEFHLMGVSFVYLILQIWQISLCLQYCLQFSWYLLVHAYFLTYCFEKESRWFIRFTYLLLWAKLMIFFHRIVKLTSPMLNCFMIFGAILLGSGIVLYNVPIYSIEVLPSLCIVSQLPTHLFNWVWQTVYMCVCLYVFSL